jgi:hypothetical protein
MVRAAFIGWQLGAGGEGKSFGAYLAELMPDPGTEESTKPRQTGAEVIRKAEIIKERLKAQRGDK